MKFTDLWEKYKNAQTTADENAFFEEEIEKFEILSDHVAEKTELEFSQDMPLSGMQFPGMQKKINRKFTKIIALSISAMLCICLIVLGVYITMDKSAYDPNAEGEESFFINTGAFVELHSPGYTLWDAKSTKTGFRQYEVRYKLQAPIAKRMDEYKDTVVNGKAMENIPEFYKMPAMNYFYNAALGDAREMTIQEMNIETMRALPSTTIVSAFLSFNQVMTMEEIDRWQQKNEANVLWIAVQNADDWRSNTADDLGYIGFSPRVHGHSLAEGIVDEETYPLLRLTMRGYREFTPQEWEVHFMSLLYHMRDSQEFIDAFCRVNNISANSYQNAIDYVEENGINTFGIMVYGTVDEIMELCQNEDVYAFVIQNAKLSWFSD